MSLVNIKSGGVTASGIRWSSSIWIEDDGFLDRLKALMEKPPQVPDVIYVSEDRADAFMYAMRELNHQPR